MGGRLIAAGFVSLISLGTDKCIPIDPNDSGLKKALLKLLKSVILVAGTTLGARLTAKLLKGRVTLSLPAALGFSGGAALFYGLISYIPPKVDIGTDAEVDIGTDAEIATLADNLQNHPRADFWGLHDKTPQVFKALIKVLKKDHGLNYQLPIHLTDADIQSLTPEISGGPHLEFLTAINQQAVLLFPENINTRNQSSIRYLGFSDLNFASRLKLRILSLKNTFYTTIYPRYQVNHDLIDAAESNEDINIYEGIIEDFVHGDGDESGVKALNLIDYNKLLAKFTEQVKESLLPAREE